MLGSRERAEDAVHETFVVALRRIGDVRDPAAAGAWLGAVLRNGCRQELRRTRVHVALGDLDPVADPVDRGERLERAEERAWVRGALASGHGVGELGALLLADIADGVRPVFQGALPGEGISLVELELVNPADDPDHCPPLLTQVLVHPRGRVERLVCRYEGAAPSTA